jgi:hypothetical protein
MDDEGDKTILQGRFDSSHYCLHLLPEGCEGAFPVKLSGRSAGCANRSV